MAQAKLWVQGRVASPAEARRGVVKALVAMQRNIQAGVAKDQFDAFTFGGHHRHGGGRWQHLAESTLAIKARLGFPPRPMIRTFAMAASTKVRVNLRMVGQFVQYDIRVVNQVPYASYHMMRSYNHWSGRLNPARHPIELTLKDLQSIQNYIHRYIRGSVAGPRSKRKKGFIGKAKLAGRSILGFLFRRR